MGGVTGALARELGWLCLVRAEELSAGAEEAAVTGAAASKWAVMGPLGEGGGALRRLAADRRWLGARTEPTYRRGVTATRRWREL